MVVYFLLIEYIELIGFFGLEPDLCAVNGSARINKSSIKMPATGLPIKLLISFG
jgi:hypothetical protein